jgi:hypothetical protein
VLDKTPRQSLFVQVASDLAPVGQDGGGILFFKKVVQWDVTRHVDAFIVIQHALIDELFLEFFVLEVFRRDEQRLSHLRDRLVIAFIFENCERGSVVRLGEERVALTGVSDYQSF